MKRILHIVGDSKYGGGSVLIERLAMAAMRHGYQPAVLTTDLTFQERLKKADVGVVSLDCIWRPIRPLRDIVGLLRLWRFLSKEHYDIVHTHTSKAGFVGRLASRLAGVPVVVHTVHGFSFHEESPRHVLLAYALLERIAARFCDAMVTVSQFHCEWAARLRIGNAYTRLSIPNGINPNRIKPLRSRAEVRASLGFCATDIICLTTGRLAKQKGLEVLFQALAKLNSVDHLRIVLAGNGEERTKLEQMARDLKVEARVVFLGFRSDLGDLLSAADMVVLPSLWEGLSISLLEAMAAGRPIITTDIGSNLEATSNGKAACIVPAGNADKLAEAIKDLSHDRIRREEIGELARREFQQNYNEELMLSRYISLYERLIIAKS